MEKERLREASRAPSCSNVNSKLATLQKGSVRELMGWVRNVVLIKCILIWETQGGSGFWVRGYMGQVREGKLVYKQPETEVDDSCHS